MLAQPGLEVATWRGATHTHERVEDATDLDATEAAVGEAWVLRGVEDALEASRVVTGDEQGGDDRPGGCAGHVDPRTHAGVLLGGGDRARERDSLHPPALENSVRATRRLLDLGSHPRLLG